MVICRLCGREFKNEHGLIVHLARTHDIHGVHGRLSLKAIYRIFPLLKKRRWSRAEKVLDNVVDKNEEDEWIGGYVHALKGMILALKTGHASPQPFLFNLKSYDRQRIEEAKEGFIRLSKKPLNTEFDEGYFKAWTDYSQYLLHRRTKLKRKEKKAEPSPPK
jgi:hypothetical protein